MYNLITNNFPNSSVFVASHTYRLVLQFIRNSTLTTLPLPALFSIHHFVFCFTSYRHNKL